MRNCAPNDDRYIVKIEQMSGGDCKTGREHQHTREAWNEVICELSSFFANQEKSATMTE